MRKLLLAAAVMIAFCNPIGEVNPLSGPLDVRL
jgi:hypothetical protein